MGVPSFYRWLVNKYPDVVENAIEDKGENMNLDTSSPNPNGIEFHNLYLDMNGIIHPCFHPEEEDITPPNTFEEVFDSIFKYIDLLFNIVRPRKLIYMAIDGVAPRAKMNQQRARRFRTARDRDIAEEEELSIRRQFEMEGKRVLPKQESEVSDSNMITPGTDFMHQLSKALKNYIKSRLTSDLGWRNIKVILSDANVPGEGEHKIMMFIRQQRIRQQRSLPSYDPNTRHCLYGLDADLIMLALATHEVHFSILREDVLAQDDRLNHLSYKPIPDISLSVTESSSLKSRGWFKNVSNLNSKENHGYSIIRSKPYQFLHVWILREYLELDLQVSDPPESFKFDIERIIDDFIFLCFFVGNDFLPNTPSLSIHEGAIDLLLFVYKNEMKKIGGYLVDIIWAEDKKTGFIKLSRVERFILLVGSYEEKIFMKRSELRERKLRQLCLHAVEEEDYGIMPNAESNISLSLNEDSTIVSFDNIPSSGNISSDFSEMSKNTKELKQKVKDNLRRKSDMFKNGDFGSDKVKLGSPGYKERYYREKFSAESPGEIESTRKKIVEKYTEGLLWVLLYYFSGPPSWTWFYPYHYGPFASDFKGLSQVKAKFQKGFPFKPFDQLLSVLPPRSADALPKPYRALMNDDSPIIDFYPNDFEIDVDGKRYSWQGVCKLPLIDEGRLLSETTKLEKELGVEENERNSQKLDQLLVRSTHKLGLHILSLSTHNEVNEGTSLSGEIGGLIRLCPDHAITDKEVHKSNQEETVICVLYEQPDCGPHIPRLLAGAQLPDKRIKKDDLEDTQLWHEYRGIKPSNRYNMNNIQDKFREVSTNSEPTGSGWRSAGRGKAKTADYGSLVSETSQRRTSFITYSSHDQTLHKGAGSGWGNSTGRGKPIICDSNSKAQNMTAGRMMSGEKVNLRYDPASFRRTSGVEWKKVVVGASTGRSGNDSRESRTPEWSCLPSNEGVHPGNGGFWPSRNNNWRQSTSQYSADKGSEREQEYSEDSMAYNWQYNSSKAGNYNRTMQARPGRGQSVHRG